MTDISDARFYLASACMFCAGVTAHWTLTRFVQAVRSARRDKREFQDIYTRARAAIRIEMEKRKVISDPQTTIEIGDEVKDAVTGFAGMVVADYRFLHGCRRLSVQPRELKDGKPIEAVTFDELQLELVASKRHQPVRRTGGPNPDPPKRMEGQR